MKKQYAILNSGANTRYTETTHGVSSLEYKGIKPIVLATLLVSALSEDANAIDIVTAMQRDNNELHPKSFTYQDNPVAQSSIMARSSSGVSDIVGTTSIENFQGTQSNLGYTHESADGFRNYFTSWYKPNFAYRDSNVSSWLFHDSSMSSNYDLWTSGSGTDYGIDGVKVAFHSGHGGMTNNTYYAPMGSSWSSVWQASSSKMALGGNYWGFGDERLRYMFWDTCYSVRVGGGNNPYTTWSKAAKGIRMIFGYETTSIDSPNYGSYFWQEWTKGKTFKQAFLDASWRINTGQSPAVVAFGSDVTSAKARLDSERFFQNDAVSSKAAAWSWYNARSMNVSLRHSLLDEFKNPVHVTAYKVIASSNKPQEVAEIAQAFHISVTNNQQIKQRKSGINTVNTKGAVLAVDENGNFDLTFKKVLKTNVGKALDDQDLINRAEELVGQLPFTQDKDIQVGLVRDTHEGSMSQDGQQATAITEKTVVFEQLVEGIPFVDANNGHLEISFNAQSGQINRIRSSLKRIDLAMQAKRGNKNGALTVDQARLVALKQLSDAVESNPQQRKKQGARMEIIPNSEAIGYQLINGEITPVYRAEINDRDSETERPHLAIVPLIHN